jgi:hypothetical protein
MYRPSASSLDHTREHEPVRTETTNISIDRVDNDSITFSYDLPVEYSNEQIYQDIVNRITGIMPQTSQPNLDDRDRDRDDDDDIMEVD